MIGVILTLVVVGLLVWMIETYIPMAPPFKVIIRVVVVVLVILWLLRIFGVGDVPIPRLR